MRPFPAGRSVSSRSCTRGGNTTSAARYRPCACFARATAAASSGASSVRRYIDCTLAPPNSGGTSTRGRSQPSIMRDHAERFWGSGAAASLIRSQGPVEFCVLRA